MEQAIYSKVDEDFKLLNLKDYYQRLLAHNWFWRMEDVVKKCKAGQREEEELKNIADLEGGEYGELFDAFAAYYDAKIQGKAESLKLPKPPT